VARRNSRWRSPPTRSATTSAQDIYQDFKFKVVARLPQDGWMLSEDDIRDFITQLEQERGRGRA
jgi:hypothetical protein